LENLNAPFAVNDSLNAPLEIGEWDSINMIADADW
jgi:hypothetical protein